MYKIDAINILFIVLVVSFKDSLNRVWKNSKEQKLSRSQYITLLFFKEKETQTYKDSNKGPREKDKKITTETTSWFASENLLSLKLYSLGLLPRLKQEEGTKVFISESKKGKEGQKNQFSKDKK